ncbi:pyruvate dehydrogenase E2 component (dihydrolipoamide acetyltransferase) [Cohaesibacter sp. ES.047]|uniref:alpha/beta fold hydrolase n=1 Tax=Cohaesibacter sp. ES.047 TaxID=1798205 RepID=UPI000BB71964|nr:alpha/beta fold hydrolase [Cohaesibacter sp. ES.047]SNY91472.1 pyruvate dehydrogenase E2 component (dihydrolipoamide acetyltransferase) [Cohaesibacter sp. ES.047]
METKLNYKAMGPEGGGAGGVASGTVVFLHGFGGDLSGWTNFQVGLSASHRSLAFDLPGHGGSVNYGVTCNAAVAAKAVGQDLDALGVAKVHLVGHSMGGAAAAVLALKRPQMVASMTLLAPGGFGPEIDQALLRAFAGAFDVESLHGALSRFFGPDFRLPRKMAEYDLAQRQRPGAQKALAATADAILHGDGQKVLPLDRIGALPIPIRVIWGAEDAVVPVSQAFGLPPMVAVHVFPGVGHMPHLEAGRSVLSLVRQTIRSAR